MRFGSVCSGIEAASVAFKPLGWTAAWFSEIEPFPCEVLRQRFPDVPNLGDMSDLPEKIRSGAVEAPDMLCGGTPCQAFSFAGKRLSLDDARGNLSLTFCEVADAIDCVRGERGLDAAIVFWENVPGVLVTKDNAFGCFLGQLVGADAPLSSGTGRWPSAGVVAGPKRKAAWRVLDAQYFGVPQRRRRVFVVASARDDFDPPQVLFERQGVRGDSPSSGDAGENAAAGSQGGIGECGEDSLIVGTLTARDAEKQFANNQSVDNGMSVVEPVVYDMTHANDVIRESREVPTLQARMGTGGNQVPLVISENGNSRAVDTRVSPPIKTTSPCYCLNDQGGERMDVNIELAGTLRAETHGHNPIVVHTHKESPCYCIAENTIGRLPKNGGNGLGVSEEIGFTLNATGVHGVLAPDCITRGGSMMGPSTSSDAQIKAVFAASGRVRRLTPVECERLQGFPDNWTRIPWRGKDEELCPDAPRYKAIGNSWAVPCVRWIGRRIQDQLMGAY